MSAPDLQPAGIDAAITQLSACLALVRPVSMSDDAADEWLAVAASDLSHFPADLLAEACKAARLECQYHGQLVPFIAKRAGERFGYRQTIAGPPRIPRERRIEQQRWQPEPGEFERIRQEAAARLRSDEKR